MTRYLANCSMLFTELPPLHRPAAAREAASVAELSLNTVDGDEAEALKNEAWALDALAERGYFNERLDQLLVDVLLGVR